MEYGLRRPISSALRQQAWFNSLACGHLLPCPQDAACLLQDVRAPFLHRPCPSRGLSAIYTRSSFPFPPWLITSRSIPYVLFVCATAVALTLGHRWNPPQTIVQDRMSKRHPPWRILNSRNALISRSGKPNDSANIAIVGAKMFIQHGRQQFLDRIVNAGRL